jgi:hypothetical protein
VLDPKSFADGLAESRAAKENRRNTDTLTSAINAATGA